MTFEEEFPSLIKCDGSTTIVEDIEEHCLDKQRVKEALQHMRTFIHIDRDIKNKVTLNDIYNMFEEMEKVLGLDK